MEWCFCSNDPGNIPSSIILSGILIPGNHSRSPEDVCAYAGLCRRDAALPEVAEAGS